MNKANKNFPLNILWSFLNIWISFLVFIGASIYLIITLGPSTLEVPALMWSCVGIDIFVTLIFCWVLVRCILKIKKTFVFLKDLDQSFNYKLILFLFLIPIVSLIFSFIAMKKVNQILTSNDLGKFDYDWNALQKDFNQHKKIEENTD